MANLSRSIVCVCGRWYGCGHGAWRGCPCIRCCSSRTLSRGRKSSAWSRDEHQYLCSGRTPTYVPIGRSCSRTDRNELLSYMYMYTCDHKHQETKKKKMMAVFNTIFVLSSFCCPPSLPFGNRPLLSERRRERLASSYRVYTHEVDLFSAQNTGGTPGAREPFLLRLPSVAAVAPQ